MSQPDGSRPARHLRKRIRFTGRGWRRRQRSTQEAFYALDDPLEAAVFSVLLKLAKEMDKADRENESGELPISKVKVNA